MGEIPLRGEPNAGPPPFPLLARGDRGEGSLIGPLPTAHLARYIRCVFWLRRPPYVRWAAAAAVVLAALLWDLRDEAASPYPFAASGIAAGTPITESMIEWRNLPQGAMALPDLSDPVAARDVPAGEPIVPSAVSGPPAVPDGWWSIPVPLSPGAVPGTQIRLIDTASGLEADGLVVVAGSDDVMSIDTSGLVAVPPDAAAAVAIAASQGTLVVLLAP